MRDDSVQDDNVRDDPVLALEGVSLQFPGAARGERVLALDEINLRIGAGERVALVGSNGSGKSSLLRVLHGLVPVSAGQVLRSGTLRQAMLFQRPHMLRASALNNVAIGLWLQGRKWSLARRDAALALERVGMAGVAGQMARTLSGGQQQRLALARAWACQPDIWMLDEPTSSLDPHAKREVERLMAEFAASAPRAGATTMVFASHNLGQVKRLAERVIYLEAGRVLADLPTGSFFDGDQLKRVAPAAHLFLKGEMA